MAEGRGLGKMALEDKLADREMWLELVVPSLPQHGGKAEMGLGARLGWSMHIGKQHD